MQLKREGITDAAFDRFVAQCRADFSRRQAQFQDRIAGGNTWRYDLSSLSLTVDSDRFAVVPIGTYSHRSQSWLWAWANEDFPLAARTAAETIQELYKLTGFRVFVDAGIPASPGDAHDLVALAIHQLDAGGLFRCPANTETPELYLAVFVGSGPGAPSRSMPESGGDRTAG